MPAYNIILLRFFIDIIFGLDYKKIPCYCFLEEGAP